MADLKKLPGYQGSLAVVMDAAGELIAPDSWPHAYDYNVDGTINYDSITDGTSTWRQTYSYAAGELTGVSAWVKQ